MNDVVPSLGSASPAGTRLPAVIFGKLVLVALFWGGTFVAGRILAQALPSLEAALWRFAVAAVFLLLVAWKVEGGLPRLTAAQAFVTFILGVTGIFFYNVCFFGALSYLPAGRTALFVALNPTVTALLAAALFGEQLGLRRWCGIVIAFCGAAIVITHGDIAAAVHDITQSFGAGEALMVGAVLSWSSYTVLGRVVLNGLTPIAATTYATLWGVLLLALGALFTLPAMDAGRFSWQVLFSILYLGAIGTVVAFIWYYEGIKAAGPARAAIFINLVPVFGVVLAWIFLSEPIMGSMVVGGALTIGGVMLTNSGSVRLNYFREPTAKAEAERDWGACGARQDRSRCCTGADIT